MLVEQRNVLPFWKQVFFEKVPNNQLQHAKTCDKKISELSVNDFFGTNAS
jgi:hypothetical protein